MRLVKRYPHRDGILEEADALELPSNLREALVTQIGYRDQINYDAVYKEFLSQPRDVQEFLLDVGLVIRGA